MEQRYGVHIIIAGKGVYDTFRKTLRSGFYPLDNVIIIRDNKSLKDEYKSKDLRDISDSINSVKKMCSELGIEFSIKRIKTSEFYEIIEEVIKIAKEIRIDKIYAEFYSNVTGGTKIASIGLFIASVWIEAIPYYVFKDEITPLELKIPKIHYEDIKKNPNHITILRILEKEKMGCSNSELIKILEGLDKKNKHGGQKYRVIRQSTSSGKLTRGNLSKMLKTLRNWGFIELVTKDDKMDERVKNYRITNDGKLILKMFED